MTTFNTGVSVTATLRNLADGGTPVTSIVSPDTLTLAVYSSTGVDQAVTATIAGDGAGNYSATFTTPALPGAYYLLWTPFVGGHTGKVRLDFQLRRDV
jgi:hypothetical protein